MNIARLIDHTLLKPEASLKDIERLCAEAEEYGFFSVCVNPCFIKTANKILSGSNVSITTVIGFPLGATFSGAKVFEAMKSVHEGADELDMVMNIGTAKAGKWDAVKKEISDFVTATPSAVHKIIIETCYLSDDEKIKASLAVMEAGAEFVKTSTGFASAGAAVRDVEIIRKATGGRIGIKAAGGIKTLKEVLSFTGAGATRIGTSSGVGIMKEALS
ncbi:MAG: deoxyribose-phosphate aldolase [Nitrospirae bacterium]|nr:deoxyribose-phosphate aldolase [Nitrospirota bacterium]MBI4837987.1 deoxyribose-phosphate aldolase [Nitrospirota bacterium]